MAMIKCAKCGEEISDKASKCVHCGTTDFLKKEKKKDVKKEVITKEVIEEDTEKVKELKEELEKVKIENLKKEIELEKKKAPKEKKNYFPIIVNIIRYCIAIFCSFGVIGGLVFGKIVIGIGYLIIGISFYPFIYKKLWEKVNVSKKLQIIIQIVGPIICIIIGGSIWGLVV